MFDALGPRVQEESVVGVDSTASTTLSVIAPGTIPALVAIGALTIYMAIRNPKYALEIGVAGSAGFAIIFGNNFYRISKGS